MANNTKVNVRGVVVVKEATSFLSGKSKVQVRQVLSLVTPGLQVLLRV